MRKKVGKQAHDDEGMQETIFNSFLCFGEKV